jgi:hypothetical protein
MLKDLVSLFSINHSSFSIHCLPLFDTQLLKSMNKFVFLSVFLFFWCFQSIHAQRVWKLRNTDIALPNQRNAILPLTNKFVTDQRLLASFLDQQINNISLYHSKQSSPVYLQNLATIEKSLRNLHLGYSTTALLEQIKPNIDFLEKDLKQNNLKSKKSRRRHHATALNLAAIYRCLNDYDRALKYVDLIIEQKYSSSYPIASQIANSKESFLVNEYFKKNGRNIYQDDQLKILGRVDSLRLIRQMEGSVLLSNGETVKGKLLDLIGNFHTLKIKFQYEKKLNAPIADKEFSLGEVLEIRILGWNLAIIPENNQFFLTEIIYESSQMMLTRSLMKVGINNILNFGGGEIPYFLGDKKNWKFHRLGNSLLAKDNGDYPNFSSRDFSDCNEIAQRIRFGCYLPRQYLEVLSDYDRLCNTTQIDETKEAKPAIRKGNIARTPKVFIGSNVGINSTNTAFGLSSSFRIRPKVNARLGFGWGFWGTKFSTGIKYDFSRNLRFQKGWSLAAGYGYSLGTNKIVTVNVQKNTQVGSGTPNVTDVEVGIRESPVSTVSFSTIYNRHFSKKLVFLAELGFAKALQKDPWTIVSGQANADETRTAIKIFQPGGIIMTLGVHYGF